MRRPQTIVSGVERAGTATNPSNARGAVADNFVASDQERRSEIERTLHESERQFRLLVESVADYAIFMLDTEGRIVTWNSGAARVKGYDAAEIIGHDHSRFYTEDDRAKGLPAQDRKSTRLNSSHSQISYAVFCLKKKKTKLHVQLWSNSRRH